MEQIGTSRPHSLRRGPVSNLDGRRIGGFLTTFQLQYLVYLSILELHRFHVAIIVQCVYDACLDKENYLSILSRRAVVGDT